eukprot:TRINITY_DN66125_c3_g1_i1.p1 TRINITY_DN66125_c3_g1~~TRINITY_DN66125_c3_g1_i1.p1  ORF type:complete len:920 (+),score=537.65 TRINITY_DN66125_c3_g1_i1:235-2994(+)
MMNFKGLADLRDTMQSGLTAGLSGFQGMFGGRGDPREPSETPMFRDNVQRLSAAAAEGDMKATKAIIAELGPDDAAVFRCFEIAVGNRDDVAAVALAESGMMLDQPNWSGTLALDVVFVAFRATNDPVLLDILGFVAMRMNTIRALKLLKTYIKQMDFKPDDLESVSKCIVSGSDMPMTTALEVAEMFQGLAETSVISHEEYAEIQETFTKTAISLLNDIESDHLAAIMLEQADSLGNSPISVALRSNNIHFVGNGRVTRIMNTLWSTPHFMQRSDFSSGGARFSKLVSIMVTEPKSFFMLPIGKFVLEAFSFLIFLLLFSFVVSLRLQLVDPIHYIEFALWVIVGAFLAGELREMWDSGMLDYFSSGWNILDITIYVSFVFIAFARIATRDVTDGDDTETHGALYRLQSSYVALMAVNSVLLWVRVSFIFAIHPTVGPLLRMMERMLTDLKNFLVLMALFIAGFALAMHFMLADKQDDYRSWSNTILTLFRALLGDFDYDWGTADRTLQDFAELLFSAYLIISNIMLLNMLIAMMSDSYAKVQEAAMLEFAFSRSKLIHAKDSDNNELPPPFNIIMYMVYYVIVFINLWGYVLCCCCRRNRSKGGGGGVNNTVYNSSFGGRKSAGAGDDDDEDPADWYNRFEDDQKERQRREKDIRAALLKSQPISAANTDARSALHDKGGSGGGDYEQKHMSEEDLMAIDPSLIERFRCGHCHHMNSSTTTKSMLRMIQRAIRKAEREHMLQSGDTQYQQVAGGAGEDGKPEMTAEEENLEMDLSMMATTTVVCSRCFRVKKEIDESDKLREDVSFAVFMVLLWVPIFVLLVVPFLVIKAFNWSVEILQTNQRLREQASLQAEIKRQEIKMRLKGKSVDRKKVEWVKGNFHKPKPGPDDIFEKLDAIEKRLKKIAQASKASKKNNKD